jgi:asparagine synthetase B (glutamine-hydrolysing)
MLSITLKLCAEQEIEFDIGESRYAAPYEGVAGRGIIGSGKITATKVDGATMHYALEARSPFLDQDIWGYAARLHPDVRLYRGRLKAILRELACRHLDARVAYGPKRGFSVPAERWLVTAWRGKFSEQLSDLRLAREGLIDPAALRRLWRQVKNSPSAPRQLWYIHAIETWLRHEEIARGPGPPIAVTSARREPMSAA